MATEGQPSTHDHLPLGLPSQESEGLLRGFFLWKPTFWSNSRKTNQHPTALHRLLEKERESRSKLPALVPNQAVDPFLWLAWALGSACSIICLVIGLGGFNAVPNFGYLTFQWKSSYATSIAALTVVIGNIIALLLNTPISRLMTVYLKYRFGRGEIIMLRDLNLFRIVTAGSLFTWDGIKAWCRAPWPLMIATLPLGLLSFTNTLIVPLLTQSWGSFIPTEVLWSVDSIPYLDNGFVQAITASFATVAVDKTINQLSYKSSSNLSYESSILYAINPKEGSWWGYPPIYSGPGLMPWTRGIPAIPYPLESILELESTLAARFYTNCLECTDVITKYNTAGLLFSHVCDVLAGQYDSHDIVPGAYQLVVPLEAFPWTFGCNFTVSGASFTVQRARNNGTGWFEADPGGSFSVDSTFVLPHAVVLANMLSERRSFLVEYLDCASVEGRTSAANTIGAIYANTLAALYFAVFSSYIIWPGQTPTRPLDVRVWSGLFGQDNVSITTAVLLSLVVLLSTTAITVLWRLSMQYISTADLTNPLSTLVLDAVTPEIGVGEHKLSTGDPEKVLERLEAIRVGVECGPTGEQRLVILAARKGDDGKQNKNFVSANAPRPHRSYN